MRELMLPGLRNAALCRSFSYTKEFYAAEAFNSAYESAPILPTVSLPVAVAMGAAAVLINNPEVTRRNLFNRVLNI
jgi:hypothetical protein